LAVDDHDFVLGDGMLGVDLRRKGKRKGATHQIWIS
jgi:hypothetical protein